MRSSFSRCHASTCAGAYCSRIWANDWIRTYSDGLASMNDTGLILTRGLWLGAQRFGVVLWSSDIFSTFDSLTRQVRNCWRSPCMAGFFLAGHAGLGFSIPATVFPSPRRCPKA